jgi:ribosomal protein L11 methyltransferase
VVQPPSSDALVLRLDPGLAFGTGSHPNDAAVPAVLRDNLRGGESVLDYGCGSGILAIAAAKLGAARVVGVDVDPQAMRASTANAAMNSVDARLRRARLPWGTTASTSVVANILTNPLIMLAPALCAARRGRRHHRAVRACSPSRRMTCARRTTLGLHSRR